MSRDLESRRFENGHGIWSYDSDLLSIRRTSYESASRRSLRLSAFRQLITSIATAGWHAAFSSFSFSGPLKEVILLEYILEDTASSHAGSGYEVDADTHS